MKTNNSKDQNLFFFIITEILIADEENKPLIQRENLLRTPIGETKIKFDTKVQLISHLVIHCWSHK